MLNLTEEMANQFIYPWVGLVLLLLNHPLTHSHNVYTHPRALTCTHTPLHALQGMELVHSSLAFLALYVAVRTLNVSVRKGNLTVNSS